MQENKILIFHNSGLNAICFSAKLKLLANRFLHFQFYVPHHLKEEGSGANTWMQKPTQFLVWGHPFYPRGLQKSLKKWQELLFNKKLKDFENH